MGVPLALPAFLDSVPDEYLRASIRLGRPGRVMPAFASLSDAQVDAIVAHLRGWSACVPPPWSDTPVHGTAVRGRGRHRHRGDVLAPRAPPVIAPALNNAGFLAAATRRP